MVEHKPPNLQLSSALVHRLCRGSHLWEHNIASDRTSADEDEQDEIEHEEGKCKPLQAWAPVTVREVCAEGRDDAGAHDNCMPCPCKVADSFPPRLERLQGKSVSHDQAGNWEGERSGKDGFKTNRDIEVICSV